ncbi:MAG: DUF6488 family protein [Gammaproteobacteria bacterium]
MKTLLKLTALLATLTYTTLGLAHEGHEHAQQLDQASAVQAAATKMNELINEGMLSSSWTTQTPAGAQLARVDGRQNWIVSYLDTAARERLELIFTMTGEFVSMAKMPISGTAAN